MAFPTPDMHGATAGLLAGHLGTHHGGAAHLLMQRGALPQREFAGMQAGVDGVNDASGGGDASGTRDSDQFHGGSNGDAGTATHVGLVSRRRIG